MIKKVASSPHTSHIKLGKVTIDPTSIYTNDYQPKYSVKFSSKPV